MYATRDSSVLKALLKLSHPAFDAKAGKLAFAVSVLPADAQRLSLSGGATARVRSLLIMLPMHAWCDGRCSCSRDRSLSLT